MSNVDTVKSPYVQENVGGFVGKISWQARKKMFRALTKLADPTDATTVLDVGVTCDQREDSNFFEKLYPYPQNLTAVGMEEAAFLEQDFPGLTYVQADGLHLPFADKTFDLVVSFAVVEHVGSRERQHAFIQELCRVGHSLCITTPNRWYPIEFHSIVPLIHWLPPTWFRKILRWLGKDFYAQEENLNLLTRNELKAMFPANAQIHEAHHKLLGFVSNLVFYVQVSQPMP